MTAIESGMAPLSPPTNGTLAPADGLPDGAPTPPPTSTFDPALMRPYLLALLPPMLGCMQAELEDQLFDADYEERVTRFAAEGGGPLYIVKRKEGVEGTGRVTPLKI